jgi:hypothetical protein
MTFATRPPQATDAAAYAALFADPSVAAVLWPGELGGARTPEQAAKLLAAEHAGLPHWFGRFVLA